MDSQTADLARRFGGFGIGNAGLGNAGDDFLINMNVAGTGAASMNTTDAAGARVTANVGHEGSIDGQKAKKGQKAIFTQRGPPRVNLDQDYPMMQEKDAKIKFFAIQCCNGSPDIHRKYQYLFEEVRDKRNSSPVVRIDDITHKLTYSPGAKYMTLNTHIGQRKLMLSEVQFLTDWLRLTNGRTANSVNPPANVRTQANADVGASMQAGDDTRATTSTTGDLRVGKDAGAVNDPPMPNANTRGYVKPNSGVTAADIESVTVVYAGAAPSHHTGMLSDLFPTVKFILIDPNEFNVFGKKPVILSGGDVAVDPSLEHARMMINKAVDGTEKIYVINTYMNHALAQAIRERFPREDHGLVVIPVDQRVPMNTYGANASAGVPVVARDGRVGGDYAGREVEGVIATRDAPGRALNHKLFFICDIRTNMSMSDKFRNMFHDPDHPSDVDIVWNLCQQYNWIVKMLPDRSLLKFRHPFFNDEASLIRKVLADDMFRSEIELAEKNHLNITQFLDDERLPYLGGYINLQVWPGKSSTEARLDTDGLTLVDHGALDEYEDRYTFYNNIDRWAVHHYNENSDSTVGFQKHDNRYLGFDHCNDCAVENLIWKRYLAKFGDSIRGGQPRETVRRLVKELSVLTHRHLNRMENHGKLTTPTPWHVLAGAVEQYNIIARVPIEKCYDEAAAISRTVEYMNERDQYDGIIDLIGTANLPMMLQQRHDRPYDTSMGDYFPVQARVHTAVSAHASTSSHAGSRRDQRGQHGSTNNRRGNVKSRVSHVSRAKSDQRGYRGSRIDHSLDYERRVTGPPEQQNTEYWPVDDDDYYDAARAGGHIDMIRPVSSMPWLLSHHRGALSCVWDDTGEPLRKPSVNYDILFDD